ncbi:MAG: xylan 1,4-beta-xylosidase [Eubacteriaceae bacterium]|nr:xylan 1,4-beta-xylosidase [Eubacteriaceae bacterium]
MAKKKDKRFVIKTVNTTFVTTTQILIDKETGVNYLFHHEGYAGGLTPLLDSTGKVVVSQSWEYEDE